MPTSDRDRKLILGFFHPGQSKLAIGLALLLASILVLGIVAALIGQGGEPKSSYSQNLKSQNTVAPTAIPTVVFSTSIPTATPIPAWATFPTSRPVSSRSITRASIQQPFEEAGFRFYGHGELSPDWYTGEIWDGSGVTIGAIRTRSGDRGDRVVDESECGTGWRYPVRSQHCPCHSGYRADLCSRGRDMDSGEYVKLARVGPSGIRACLRKLYVPITDYGRPESCSYISRT